MGTRFVNVLGNVSRDVVVVPMNRPSEVNRLDEVWKPIICCWPRWA